MQFRDLVETVDLPDYIYITKTKVFTRIIDLYYTMAHACNELIYIKMSTVVHSLHRL